MEKIKIRRWIWLVLLVLTLVGISCYGGAVSYGFFWCVFLMPVVSFAYLLWVYMRFRIYQEIESRQLVCDQAMPYYFVLRNEDWLGVAGIKVRMFPDYSYVEDIAENTEYELLPGDEYCYRTKIVCKYRGEYEIGVKEVVMTDFFYLFRFRYPVPDSLRAIVRPKLVALSQLYAMSDVEIDAHRESAAMQNEPDVLVREYVSGDYPKKIHWKLAARFDKLMVRTDIGTQRQSVCVLLDTCRYSKKKEEYLPLENKLLETVLAVTMFLTMRNIPVTVYYGQNGPVKDMVTGGQAFEEFYNRISDVGFDHREDALSLLEQVCVGSLVQDAKVLVCVFHEWNDEMMHLAEELADSGICVISYVITQEGLEQYVKQNTMRRKVIVVPVDADLEGVL